MMTTIMMVMILGRNYQNTLLSSAFLCSRKKANEEYLPNQVIEGAFRELV